LPFLFAEKEELRDELHQPSHRDFIQLKKKIFLLKFRMKHAKETCAKQPFIPIAPSTITSLGIRISPSAPLTTLS